MQTPFIKLQSGNGSVTTAGQAVQLSAVSTPCGKLTVTALKTNTDDIVYGGSNVVAGGPAASGRIGTPLVPGQSVDIPIDDLSKVWFDAAVSGNGWSHTWLS